MSLKDARIWLENKQPEAALVCLLDAWRDHKRHPAIADAIDLLSASLTTHVEPTRTKAAWRAAAESKSPVVLERLLEAIPESTDRYHQLGVVLSMPADPRMATAAKKWMEEHTVGATSRAPFYFRVVELIDRISDVRLAPFLKALTAPENRTTAVRLYGMQTWAPLVEIAERLAKKKVRELERDDVHTLAAIAKLLRAPPSTPDSEALFARVYADPSDDDARAVLADLLQQQGDPRGEFIAMQLARHGTKKTRTAAERKLSQTWARTWLGAIEPALQKQGLVFERGFVTRGRYVGGPAGAKSIGAVEWSTMTHLDVTPAGGSTELLWSKTAQNLRHVTGISAAVDLPRMLDRELVMPWETVGWTAEDWTFGRLGNDDVGKLFPDARKLVVRGADGDTLPTNADELLVLLERWPLIEELEVDAEPELVLGIHGDARGRALKRLVLDGAVGVLTIAGTQLDFDARVYNDEVRSFLSTVARRLEIDEVFLSGAATDQEPFTIRDE